MTIKEFLRDRRLYIGLYVAATLLITAVFQLDLWLGGEDELRPGTVLYGFLLALVGLALFLALDYRRQKAFFRQFEKLTGAERRWVGSGESAGPGESAGLDESAVLVDAVTLEQRLYADAWTRLYGALRADLVAERDRGQQRVRLLSQWAHHMKTPVSVIDLELQRARHLLGDDRLVPETMEQIRPIIDSVAEENARLGDALHVLLNVMRLDEFTSDFRVEKVDLLEVVRSVVNDNRRAFIVHRVYPTIESAPERIGGVGSGSQPVNEVLASARLPDGESASYIVESDRKWLRLILEQVVGNAIKYASRSDSRSDFRQDPRPHSRPDGDGHVRIRLYRAGDETLLEVADDGIGIPKEDLGRVFQPFFTGAAGRQHIGSTGMGLYLAKEAAERLGHRIRLASTVGEGTTVQICFPRGRMLYQDLIGDRK